MTKQECGYRIITISTALMATEPNILSARPQLRAAIVQCACGGIVLAAV